MEKIECLMVGYEHMLHHPSPPHVMFDGEGG